MLIASSVWKERAQWSRWSGSWSGWGKLSERVLERAGRGKGKEADSCRLVLVGMKEACVCREKTGGSQAMPAASLTDLEAGNNSIEEEMV